MARLRLCRPFLLQRQGIKDRPRWVQASDCQADCADAIPDPAGDAKGGSLELLQESQRHTSGMRLARGTFRSEQQLDDPVGPVQACPIVTLLFFVHGDSPKYTMCIINFELGN